MQLLNLGIVAHVDAGKTSLTERLLHAAGVIDEPGRVDDGNTQTDSLELERERGITIKSAVVSFAVDGVTVNLIDTPGHPDFIAEVERVLSVLDGAIVVVSAVEGVQAQTRVLRRALRQAGTRVYEPLHRFRIELPAETLGPLLPVLSGLGGIPEAPVIAGAACTLEGRIPAARVHDLRRRLPGLTRGEGLVESEFDGYEPVRGAIPERPTITRGG